MLALYISIKLIIYICVCAAAVPMLQLKIDNKWSFGIKWGSTRFLLGLFVGIFIVMAMEFLSMLTESQAVGYIIAFGFTRYFEWLFLAYLISRKYKIDFGMATQQWMLLGVLASMLMDGVVYKLDVLGNLKFVC